MSMTDAELLARWDEAYRVWLGWYHDETPDKGWGVGQDADAEPCQHRPAAGGADGPQRDADVRVMPRGDPEIADLRPGEERGGPECGEADQREVDHDLELASSACRAQARYAASSVS